MINDSNDLHSEVTPADGIPVLTDVVAPPVPVGTPPSDNQPPMPTHDVSAFLPPGHPYTRSPSTSLPTPPPIEETCSEKVEDEAVVLWRKLRNMLNRLPDELQNEAHTIASKLMGSK